MVESNAYLIVGSAGQDGILTEKILKTKGLPYLQLTKQGLSQGKKLILEYSEITPNSLSKELRKRSVDRIFFFAAHSRSSEESKRIEPIIEKNEHKRVEDLLSTILHSFEVQEKKASLFYASSMLIFSPDFVGTINEQTNPSPSSYYGEHKLKCAQLIENRNLDQKLCNASVGIFFNHESCYRQDTYFSAKIIKQALQKKFGKTLDNGPLEVLQTSRDFGYAPQYMDLAFQLLSNSKVGNFIFCTGTSISTVDFIKIVCAKLHVESRDLFRILTINEELESSHRFRGDNSKLCNTTGVDKSQILSGQTLIEKLIRDWQNKYDAE